MSGPIVFLSHAPEDEHLRAELEAHLALLKRDGHIRAWHPRLVAAGEEAHRRIAEQLDAARVVVLLISADYLASDALYREQMERASRRMRAGSALVIPVLLRPHDGQAAPIVGLAPLPRNGVPVTSWPNRDEAWADVAAGIRQAVEALLGPGGQASGKARHAPPMPRHDDAESRALATQIDDARRRLRALEEIGAPVAAVQAEIVDLRRKLREGGRLRAGDALGDGRYRLIEPIGRGGFATVWSAFDRERGEKVAVKVLHAELARDPQRRERFFRGARVMAHLGHEAVVRVLREEGEDGGYFYFVMELIEGSDLQRAVLRGGVTRDRALAIVLAVGEALAEAHAKGIIHRDVKPANILLDAAGGPRLTDFDLVAAGDTTGGTRTGALGTYLFTAPEQMHNAKDADARADVYSLGMTAVFALHGTDLPVAVTRRPEKVIAALPCGEPIKQVLTRAIEVEPGDRFPDARAFCEALRQEVVREESSRRREAMHPAAGAGAAPLPGPIMTLGRYRVADKIGEGGMASVHLARMDGPGGKLQGWVAIKCMHPQLLDDDNYVDMFLDEARITAGINHPNVVRVFDLGKDDNTYWIAMEYLHGEPLREVRHRASKLGQPIGPELAARVCADAAEGLHAAHELRGKNGQLLGLVHRHVTPHNIFLTYDGYTKIIDFGLAKVADQLSITRPGTIKGQLAYMSPEQVRGVEVDRAADIFALGIVLWETTTNQRLFRMGTDLDTLEKVLACIVPPPSTIVPGYPPELEAVVLKALSKRKEDRYQTARELSRALQSYLVRSGRFAGPEEVVHFLRAIFHDRIQKREAHLAWAAEVTSTPATGHR